MNYAQPPLVSQLEQLENAHQLKHDLQHPNQELQKNQLPQIQLQASMEQLVQLELRDRKVCKARKEYKVIKETLAQLAYKACKALAV